MTGLDRDLFARANRGDCMWKTCLNIKKKKVLWPVHFSVSLESVVSCM